MPKKGSKGQRCCIISCRATTHKRDGTKIHNGLRFFTIPKVKIHAGTQMEELTTRRRMAWISAIKRPDVTFERQSYALRVCSNHFHSGAPAYEMMIHDPDWVPSLNLGHEETKTKKFTSCVTAKASQSHHDVKDFSSYSNSASSKSDAGCQTNVCFKEILKMEFDISSFETSVKTENIVL